MADEGLDYLSLDGLVTDKTRAWGGTAQSLPAGDYVGEISEVEKGESKEKNPTFIITYKVTEGEQKDQTIRGWYALTEKAIGRLYNVLQAIGVKLDKNKGFSPKAMLGLKLAFTVIEDVQEGELNPITQQKDTKKFSKVVNERAFRANGASQASKGQPEVRA